MADPSPDETADDGQEPDGSEGQEPDASVSDDDGQEPKPEKTYSQAYVKQLRRSEAAARVRAAELETEKTEREEADKTEAQKLSEKLEAEKARADAAELKNLRTEVGAEQGLPAEALKFLTGQTREEIELHAEELSKLLKQGKPAAGFDGGARPKAPPAPKEPEQAHNEMLLRAMGRSPEG